MRKELGSFGEKTAQKYLSKKGYKIITENFRSRQGEIDIIAQDKDYLVFIEVRTKSGDFVLPRETVTKEKQRRIRKTAEYFLLKAGKLDAYCRYDVVEIIMKDGKPQINLIKDAF